MIRDDLELLGRDFMGRLTGQTIVAPPEVIPVSPTESLTKDDLMEVGREVGRQLSEAIIAAPAPAVKVAAPVVEVQAPNAPLLTPDVIQEISTAVARAVVSALADRPATEPIEVEMTRSDGTKSTAKVVSRNGLQRLLR